MSDQPPSTEYVGKQRDLGKEAIDAGVLRAAGGGITYLVPARKGYP